MRTKRFLIYSNIILLLLLGFICWRERYIPRLWQKWFPDNSVAHYQQRPAYQEQLKRYAIYQKKAAIVMLGTSLTQDIDWNELLNRGDVVNRGYGGDILAVEASRLPYILAVQPNICFLEGGINDIDTGVPVAEAIKQLTNITDSLRLHHITPVLTAITHVAETAPRQQQRNTAITAFNKELYKLAQRYQLMMVDNNPLLAPNGLLLPQYAKHDGLHYQPAAYLVWKTNIEKALQQMSVK